MLEKAALVVEGRGPLHRSRTAVGLATRVGLAAALAVWGARAGADGADLGPPPADGAAATASMFVREQKLLAGAACGAELQFFLRAQAGTTSEDQLALVIGKMGYLSSGGGDLSCQGSGSISKDEFLGITRAEDEADETYRKLAGDLGWDIDTYAARTWDALTSAGVSGLNDRLATFFGASCAHMVASMSPAGDSLALTYTVAPGCLTSEVNVALAGMANWGKWNGNHDVKEPERAGSSAVPCNIFGKTVGEWDVKVRDLVRVLYLDGAADGTILDPGVRDGVFGKLVTIRGKLGEASYSLLQCGDSESTTGSPQDGVDEGGGGSDLGDVAGDAGDWLLKRLAFLLAVALIILAAATIIGGVLGALAGAITLVAGGAAATVLVATLTWGRIPESENHRLMIESSRYLANQWALDHLGDADPGRYPEFQSEIKEWLLERFQKVLSGDFSEYNARPYQRYAMDAVLNIADFARDPDLRLAARMVLDYDTAKIALGSYQDRRLVPFRRLMEEVTTLVGRQDLVTSCVLGSADPAKACPPPRDLLDFGGGADYGLELMMAWAGDTEQLDPSGHVAGNGVSDMVYPATSGYQPESFVLDLALHPRASFQTVHHAGFELYSSGPGFLITGGGIETAATGELEFPPGTKPLELNLVELFRNTDRGAGLPTTLMLGAAGTRDLSRFIRIEGPGKLTAKNHFDDGRWLTYDGNLCVWRGFACGINVEIPPELDACAVADTAQDGGVWRFIDSQACGGANAAAPRVFVAIYRACGSSADCTQNTGFLEVLPAAPSDQLSDFHASIVNANPRPNGSVYHSASRHDIGWGPGLVDFAAVELVSSVDGAARQNPGDWPFLTGDFLNGDGSGRVTIANPAGGTLTLDLSNRDHPVRTVN